MAGKSELVPEPVFHDLESPVTVLRVARVVVVVHPINLVRLNDRVHDLSSMAPPVIGVVRHRYVLRHDRCLVLPNSLQNSDVTRVLNPVLNKFRNILHSLVV